MAIIDIFRPKKRTGAYNEAIAEIKSCAAENTVRQMCFNVCVNMVAAAFARCEFRTYRDRKEVQDAEYWMWNVEPNINENSTAFLHKAIDNLYRSNELLIVETKGNGGSEAVVVADTYTEGKKLPKKQREYTDVTVGDFAYDRKTFRENEVIHIKLNAGNIKPILDGIARSHESMIDAARSFYSMGKGTKLKLKIDAVETSTEGFKDRLREKIDKQVKPFVENPNAVLPETSGYTYEYFAGPGQSATSQDIRDLIEDVWNQTARAFLIPIVLVNGKVEATGDANKRFLTSVIDPLADQWQEEINRKRYGFEAWKRGTYMRVDTSAILHFDIFEAAASVEKIIGSAMTTVNDVRRAAGMEPITEPWADEHYMTKNIATVGEAVNPVGQ